MLLDDGVAVAVLTNQDAVGAASTIAHLVAGAVSGVAGSKEESEALALYRGLQQGKIDRTLLAPNLNDYFTEEALTDFARSLAPLGEPISLQQRGESLRGGMKFRSFRINYADKHLNMTTYTYPDGKLEQLLIAPVE